MLNCVIITYLKYTLNVGNVNYIYTNAICIDNGFESLLCGPHSQNGFERVHIHQVYISGYYRIMVTPSMDQGYV